MVVGVVPLLLEPRRRMDSNGDRCKLDCAGNCDNNGRTEDAGSKGEERSVHGVHSNDFPSDPLVQKGITAILPSYSKQGTHRSRTQQISQAIFQSM